MRAAVYLGPRSVAIREVGDPVAPSGGDALVRVSLSAICGTDLHVAGGHLAGVSPGIVLGHEFVGEVLAVAPDVRRIRAGQLVMASDFTACGACRWCDRREHWHCARREFFGTGTAFGPALAGAQAELVLVPFADTTLHPVPEGCSPEAALLIGDNLATAWAAIERAQLGAGDCVAIIGGGAVGQLVSQCAQVATAGRVMVVEPEAVRRRFAEEQGALSAAPEEAEALLRAVTDQDGADVVVDAVGGAGPLDLAFRLARRGGRIISVGAHSAETWPLPVAEAFNQEKSLAFVIGNSIRWRRELVQLVRGGAIDPTVVIDSRVALRDVPLAYERLFARELLKVVIDLGR